jgi:hypothetical protein
MSRRRRTWLAEYLHELTAFPNGRHDDQSIRSPSCKQAGREPGIVACYRMRAEELRGPKTANPIIEPQLRPIVTKRRAATAWPWHMKGLEMRFVSALFLWAFSEADGNDGLW